VLFSGLPAGGFDVILELMETRCIISAMQPDFPGLHHETEVQEFACILLENMIVSYWDVDVFESCDSGEREVHAIWRATNRKKTLALLEEKVILTMTNFVDDVKVQLASIQLVSHFYENDLERGYLWHLPARMDMMSLVLDSMLRHNSDVDIQKAGMYALCHFDVDPISENDTGLLTTIVMPAILDAIFKVIESNEDLAADAFETYRLLLSSQCTSDWINRMIKDGVIEHVAVAVYAAFRVNLIPLHHEDQNKMKLQSGDSELLRWIFLSEFAFDMIHGVDAKDTTCLWDKLLDEVKDEEACKPTDCPGPGDQSFERNMRAAVQASLMKHSVDTSVILEVMLLHPENYRLSDTACDCLNRLLSTSIYLPFLY